MSNAPERKEKRQKKEEPLKNPAFNEKGYVDGATTKYFGRNIDSFCMMNTNSIFKPALELFSIKNPRLQFIFNHATTDLEKALLDLKKEVEDTQFKYEVMIAFWFAIHTNELEIA